MGYFYRTLPSNEGIKLKKENFEKAYLLAIELNGKQTARGKSIWCLKHGGRNPANIEYPKESKSNGNPNVWFGGVPWNYDETCKDIFEVFEIFGFITETNANGDIIEIKYPEEKEGDESALLVAIAPCIEPHQLYFLGQDDALWYFSFDSYYPKGCRIYACNEPATGLHATAGLVLLNGE